MYTFTEFLSLSQLDLFYQKEAALDYAGTALFGGNEECERKVLRFGRPGELGYEEPFPIACIAIEPAAEKFAEVLSHRDYLGALMSLGIERENLGDIFIREKTGYVFCLERIAPYLLENLTQIRHNQVKLSLVADPGSLPKPRIEPVQLVVSSTRLDGVVAKLFNLSRSQSLELFRTKRIYVNNRICENNSGCPRAGDKISVRGYGKFIYEGMAYQTKKGKISLQVSQYK
jgi:RNA-binding protein YlmH